MPLPIANAFTAVFLALSTLGTAAGRASRADLAKLAQVSRATLGLASLAFSLPRAQFVPAGVSRPSAAAWAAARLGLGQEEALRVVGSVEDALEAALLVLPFLTWLLCNRLWRVTEPARREAPAETKKAK